MDESQFNDLIESLQTLQKKVKKNYTQKLENSNTFHPSYKWMEKGMDELHLSLNDTTNKLKKYKTKLLQL